MKLKLKPKKPKKPKNPKMRAALLAACLIALFSSCASYADYPSRTRKTKRRLFVAIIIPREQPQISMPLLENVRLLRKRIRRVHGRPRVSFRLITWQKFIRNSAYVAYDAVIYIALYDQLPSDFATSTSNVLGRSLFELFESSVFEQFTQPKRFIWLLFRETARLDQYRLRFPDSPYQSSNTGSAALRRIFRIHLFTFLLNLKELYLYQRG